MTEARAAAERIAGVDAQVLLAASEMNDAQKAQPEWLWFENYAAPEFGRWPKDAGEKAPYIRADLVLAALTTAHAAGRREGLEEAERTCMDIDPDPRETSDWRTGFVTGLQCAAASIRSKVEG